MLEYLVFFFCSPLILSLLSFLERSLSPLLLQIVKSKICKTPQSLSSITLCKIDPFSQSQTHPVWQLFGRGALKTWAQLPFARASYLHLFTCATLCTFGFSACHSVLVQPLARILIYTHTYAHRQHYFVAMTLWVVPRLPLWQNETDG